MAGRQEVAALLTKAETRARDLLTSHREALAQLTAALLEQETVTGDQVRALAHGGPNHLLPLGMTITRLASGRKHMARMAAAGCRAGGG